MVFSDEATFMLNGSVNTRNVHRYALPANRGGDGRPENFIQPRVNYDKKCMVFLGLHPSGKYFMADGESPYLFNYSL